MFAKDKRMGGRHVCVYRPLIKNFAEFRKEENKGVLFIALSGQVFFLHLHIPGLNHASQVLLVFLSAIVFGILYSIN